MSDKTSPIPRILPARRSGKNGSSASTFSPVPTNLIGCPVTVLMESAAPPRASPSIFVRMTPVKPKPVVKFFCTLDRILPGHRIGNEQYFHRRSCFPDLLEFRHHLFIDMKAAGSIDRGQRRIRCFAHDEAPVPLSKRDFDLPERQNIRAGCPSQSTRNCSTAAGRYTSTDNSKGV